MRPSGFPASELAGLLWRRDASTSVVWSTSPEIDAVFDPISGETHILSELPALVLRHIGTEPATAQQVFEEMSGAAFAEQDQAALDQIVAALKFLANAELVESSPAKIP